MKKSKIIICISILAAIANILFPILSDRCIQNDGVAFGIGIGNEEYITLVLIVVLIFISLLKYISSPLKEILFSIAILGSSNLFLRLIYGYVCDYIGVYNIYINIADIGIVSLVLVGIFFVLKKDANRNKR
jgi:lipoprotein signal peptidase